MFWIGVSFFSVYSILCLIDEVFFHRKRGLPRLEKNLRLLNSLILVSAIGYTIYFHYDKYTTFYFNILLAASFIAFPLMDVDSRAQVSGKERFLHGCLNMLHPQMLLLLTVTWRFIDGAGFFMKIVLPFKTENLRPLTWGFFGVMGLLFVYQVVYWTFIGQGPQQVALEPQPELSPEPIPDSDLAPLDEPSVVTEMPKEELPPAA